MIAPLHLPLSCCWPYFSLSSHWDSFLIIGKIQMVSKNGFAPVLALTDPCKGTWRKPLALCTLNTVYCKCTKSSAYLSASSLWGIRKSSTLYETCVASSRCACRSLKAKLFPGKLTFSSVLISRLYSVLLFLGPLPTQEGEMPTSLLSVEAWAEAQVAQSLPASVKRKLVYSRCHVPYNGKIREHLYHTSQRFVDSLNLPRFGAHPTPSSPALSCTNSYHKDILPKL